MCLVSRFASFCGVDLDASVSARGKAEAKASAARVPVLVRNFNSFFFLLAIVLKNAHRGHETTMDFYEVTFLFVEIPDVAEG